MVSQGGTLLLFFVQVSFFFRRAALSLTLGQFPAWGALSLFFGIDFTLFQRSPLSLFLGQFSCASERAHYLYFSDSFRLVAIGDALPIFLYQDSWYCKGAHYRYFWDRLHAVLERRAIVIFGFIFHVPYGGRTDVIFEFVMGAQCRYFFLLGFMVFSGSARRGRTITIFWDRLHAFSEERTIVNFGLVFMCLRKGALSLFFGQLSTCRSWGRTVVIFVLRFMVL